MHNLEKKLSCSNPEESFNVLLQFCDNNLDKKYEHNETILHLLTKMNFNEEKSLLGIKLLLDNGVNPNEVDEYGRNFIQTALNSGCSQDYVIKCINLALRYGLFINHLDSSGNSIIHTAFSNTNYIDDVMQLLVFACKNGFNPHMKNQKKENLSDTLMECGKYSNIYKRKVLHCLECLLDEIDTTKRKIKAKKR